MSINPFISDDAGVTGIDHSEREETDFDCRGGKTPVGRCNFFFKTLFRPQEEQLPDLGEPSDYLEKLKARAEEGAMKEVKQAFVSGTSEEYLYACKNLKRVRGQ